MHYVTPDSYRMQSRNFDKMLIAIDKLFLLLTFFVFCSKALENSQSSALGSALFDTLSSFFQPSFNPCDAEGKCPKSFWSSQEYKCVKDKCLLADGQTESLNLLKSNSDNRLALYAAIFSSKTLSEEEKLNDVESNGFRGLSTCDDFDVVSSHIGYKTGERHHHEFALYEGPDYFVLVFKGTTTSRDIAIDLNALPQDCSVVNGTDCGNLHRGFQNAFYELKSDLDNDIIGYVNASKKPLVIIGHSLGGALATICSAYIANAYPSVTVEAVLTVGSPRVGNSKFAQFYSEFMAEKNPDITLKRFVMVDDKDLLTANYDPISLLPMKLGSVYAHVIDGTAIVCVPDGQEKCNTRALHSIFRTIKSLQRRLKRVFFAWRKCAYLDN